MKLLFLFLVFPILVFSQTISNSFNKYDSVLIKEVNILRSRKGLNVLKPSLIIRSKVTNVHIDSLKKIKIEKLDWAYHPSIIKGTGENLHSSSKKCDCMAKEYSYNYTRLSILYAIDMFYQSNKIKKNKEFLDSFYNWITDTNFSLKNKDEFKSFIYDKHRDFWIEDNSFSSNLEDLIKSYHKESYNRNAILDAIKTYLDMKKLFVDEMGLSINYLFNINNKDCLLWETKFVLHKWYTSESHKNILLSKGKNISIGRSVNSGYPFILLNIGNENLFL